MTNSTYLSKAIILKRSRFKESSCLCRCITEDYGLLNFAANGTYKEKGPLTGVLEPFNEVDIELHRSSGAGLYYLRNAGLIDSYMIGIDYLKTLFLCAAGELMLQVNYPIEDSQDYYNLLKVYCSFLKTTTYHPFPVFIRYAIRLLKLLGVPLDNNCAGCGSSQVTAYCVSQHGFTCRACNPSQDKPYASSECSYSVAEKQYSYSDTLTLSDKTSYLVANIGNLKSIDKDMITNETLEEIKEIINAHLSSSFHKMFHLKSIDDCGKQFDKTE